MALAGVLLLLLASGVSLAAASSLSLSPQYDILAGVARASTPVRADRPVPASAIPGVDFAGMMAQAAANDAPRNDTHCQARVLQYEFSVRLMPERSPLRDVFDGLGLGSDCGVTPPGPVASTVFVLPLTPAALAAQCTATFYVATTGSDSAAGSVSAPFATLAHAIAATRAARPTPLAACIVLRGGVHYLTDTITLGAADSGLIVTGAFGDAPAWVSGGVPLGSLNWVSYNTAGGSNVYVADIPAGVSLNAMPGLQTLDGTTEPTRLWRAKFPNTFDQEQFNGPLPDDRDVNSWTKPPIMAIPELYYKDLKALGLKDDSTMKEYNLYAAGRGGPCAHWANDGDEWAYICSNVTAGGWEEIERTWASRGELGFPIGMTYNDSRFPSFAKWTLPSSDPTDWSNSPTITVWHNQGWFQGTYAITGLAPGELKMSADGVWPSGGWQGGRTMENRNPNDLDRSEPLGSGPWYVSNVFEELDAASEYFFDPVARKLYLYYNATSGMPPPPTFSLVASQLEVFFNATGTLADPVRDITFAGLGFRDQRPGLLDRWHDPSGGDWGIRRAGLFHFEGTERATVSGCTFFRTDANAVFLAAYNRNATVIDCEFAYVGMTCVSTFGRTHQDDGTDGEQPWGTVIAYNKAREIGTYQLQSSLWFTSKSTLTRAEGNVVFNIPRAAINFNDGLGGGNNVTHCSIFNTCRHSSDHGPMNSWDRMPFLTRIRSRGGEASYSSADTETSHSMIIANYGASQGFDNDDGSSWYDTHDNFFYDASGFKMDFGGHDSKFHSNVIVAVNGQNCLGTASFIAGHATQIYDNDCLVWGKERVDDLFENCDSGLAPNVPVHGYNNRFYTPLGNASATCDCCGERPLAQLPPGLEDNFTASTLPDAATIIAWGRAKLDL